MVSPPQLELELPTLIGNGAVAAVLLLALEQLYSQLRQTTLEAQALAQRLETEQQHRLASWQTGWFLAALGRHEESRDPGCTCSAAALRRL